MAFGILCVRSENGYDLTAMADDHRDALTMLRKGLGSKPWMGLENGGMRYTLMTILSDQLTISIGYANMEIGDDRPRALSLARSGVYS